VADRFASCRVGEVEFGVVASGAEAQRNREALEQFLLEVPVVPFDRGAARAYGPVCWATRLCRSDALDKLNAAHALALGVVLVTSNPSDFQAYPDLAIENWVAS
jgi:tRNA(fMet)-specific endonuclease VapC